MIQKFDLVIVGGSFAGLACARTAALRGLNEAMVFDRGGQVLARSSLSFTLGFEPVPDGAMHVADEGDVAVMTNDSDNRVRALVRLDQWGQVYLYIGRYIEPRVLNYMEETQRAAEAGRGLPSRTSVSGRSLASCTSCGALNSIARCTGHSPSEVGSPRLPKKAEPTARLMACDTTK